MWAFLLLHISTFLRQFVSFTNEPSYTTPLKAIFRIECLINNLVDYTNIYCFLVHLFVFQFQELIYQVTKI